MNAFVCEPLAPHHDRRRFRCGVPALDDYLRQRASQDVRRRVTAVFVMTPRDQPDRIAGYYTLSAASILLADLPDDMTRKLPRYPQVPAIRIGRLARDSDFPETGKLLLIDALSRSWQHSEAIAAAAVLVDAKDDRARGFYSHFGFVSLTNFPNKMFLPMKTIERLLQQDHS